MLGRVLNSIVERLLKALEEVTESTAGAALGILVTQPIRGIGYDKDAESRRAKVVVDINRLLTETDTKALKQHLKDAASTGEEEKYVELLSHVATEDRQEYYTYLSTLTHEEFRDEMYHLERDAVPQAIRRSKRVLRDMAEKLIGLPPEQLRQRSERALVASRTRLQDALRRFRERR